MLCLNNSIGDATLKYFLFTFLIFLSSICLAQEASIEQDTEQSNEEKFIEKDIEISEWFDDVAEGLDLFLIGKKVTKRKNETTAVVTTSAFAKDRDDSKFSGDLNVNLRLPNVEDYWQLKFTSYDANRERRVVQTGRFRNTPRERDYGATLEIFRNLGNVRTSFQPRLALQSGFKVSHVLTFESIAENKKYKINPKLQFFANADDGPGVYLAVNYNFQIDKIFSLTLINDGDYKDKIHTFVVTNGASIGHKITDRKSFSYNLFFESTNRDEYHLEGYTASVAWKEIIYKNILNYTISPFVTFQKPEAFTAAAGITVSVELQF